MTTHGETTIVTDIVTVTETDTNTETDGWKTLTHIVTDTDKDLTFCLWESEVDQKS